MKGRRQLASAGALTVLLLIALGSVGAVSYAANALQHAASSAVHAASASHANAAAKSNGFGVINGVSAGGDQYRPGYGFGDPNHNHAGPPGLSGKGGEKTPPAQARRERTKERVATRIRVDEQAALYVSVLDADGNRVVLNQNGSKVGGAVTGKQVKTIHYVVLVPRSIPIQIVIPRNQLTKGATYTIHVIAVDAQGNKSTIDIPFVA